MPVTSALLLVLALPAAALAHDGGARGGWASEPMAVVALAVVALAWVRGVRAARHTPRAEMAAFAAGWLVLAVALVSPLHPLGRELFALHMAQHELLMLVAAPLLVLARPAAPLLRGLPRPWRRAFGGIAARPAVRAAWRRVATPLVAWAIHAAALWAWHVPALFEATLRSEVAHAAQHASFLGSALLFWWALVHARPGRSAYGAAVLYLFTTSLHSGVLGALLTFSARPWYPSYADTAPAWGLTPLEDQQLGGLVMWVPAGLVYVAAGLLMLAGWLRESDARIVRREHLAAAAKVALLLVVLAACGRETTRRAAQMTGGDPARGRDVAIRAGCVSCHTIPGVRGADALVGPPLGGIARRVYIAGVLPNTPDNMIRWIEDPQAVDRLTAMPNVGLAEADARDVAAFLYTLR